MKKLSISFTVLTFLASFFGAQALASEITVGGQVGAIGLAQGPAATDLGYGAFIQASAFDYLGFQLDYMRVHFTGVGPTNAAFDAYSISPNLLFNVVKYDEFRLGLIGGPAFSKVGSDSTRFGLTGGAFGEVSFIKYMPIGLQTRYDAAFGGKNNDLWSVMMTIAFRFPIKDENDW